MWKLLLGQAGNFTEGGNSQPAKSYPTGISLSLAVPVASSRTLNSFSAAHAAHPASECNCDEPIREFPITVGETRRSEVAHRSSFVAGLRPHFVVKFRRPARRGHLLTRSRRFHPVVLLNIFGAPPIIQMRRPPPQQIGNRPFPHNPYGGRIFASSARPSLHVSQIRRFGPGVTWAPCLIRHVADITSINLHPRWL